MRFRLIKQTGYSFKSNQYGLTIDTVVGFEVVLPTGIVVNATENENPDLFWGLKVSHRVATNDVSAHSECCSGWLQ